MSLYTRHGDKGLTSLYGGKQVLKSHPLIETYGTIDELNCYIGLVKNKLKTNDKNRAFLVSVQKDLHQIMSILAGTKTIKTDLDRRVRFFEEKIDKISKRLKPLNRFIIPGETKMSSWFHILRVVCRRAERNIVRLKNENYRLKVICYFNRLSDLFFTLARYYGNGKEVIIK